MALTIFSLSDLRQTMTAIEVVCPMMKGVLLEAIILPGTLNTPILHAVRAYS